VSIERDGSTIALRCNPCDGGFAVTMVATIGTNYLIEYHLLGSGGYQESGEISGTISSQPETIHQSVHVPVIAIGATSVSFGRRDHIAFGSTTSRHGGVQFAERRSVPHGAVEVMANESGIADTSKSTK
jgi:hypothetical protein